MAKILVAGGLYDKDEDQHLNTARSQFASFLGKEIITGGHVLLGGCRTHLDATVANAAHEAAIEKKLDRKNVIRSWVTSDTSLHTTRER